MVMVIGRWSEGRVQVVVHVVCWNRLLEMVVMSGEVDCWFGFGGTLVGVSWFSVRWFELVMRCSMVVPLWSVYGECHRLECALMSPVMIEFGSVVR